MGCGSSKDTVTVVHVAPATRTQTVNKVVKETPAQFEASANDEEHYNTAHQSSDAKEEEEQTIEEPMQPVVQDLGAGNAEGDAPEEHKGDERLSSNETKDDKSTEEPVQIKQDTANDEEHNNDEQLSSNEMKEGKSTEEPVQIKQVSSEETKEDKTTEEPVQIKQAVHQHDWMAAVSESEREGWLTTCSMCGTKDDVLVVPPMAMTSGGLMTYDVETSEGDVTHVVCKPRPYSDEETYARLDAHAVNADRSLNSDFTELVTYLLQPARTDLEKARVLFRWGTAQDLVNMQFPGTLEKETPEWYLREIKEERESHVTLLAKMCSFAGLQHKIVRGHAKSVKFYPGSKLGESNFRGSWPQVLLDGRWGIMDTAWGSHHVIDDLDKTAKDLEQVYSFDEFHFLPNPRHYLSAHLPDNDKYQFLSTPSPLADFESHVKCWPNFFVHHLKLLSHHNGVVPTENGQAVIYIGFKPEDYTTIKFSAHLQTMDRQSTWKNIKLDRFIQQDRKKDAVVFTIEPPEKGRFLFDVFVGMEEDKGTKYACEYAIDCPKAKDKNAPRPEHGGTWGPGNKVMTKGIIPMSHPTSRVECPEGRAAIQFNLPEQMEFATTLFETTTEEEHLKRYVAHEVVDGVATFNVINPSRGNLGLTIYAKGQEDKGKTFPHLCTYLASTDSPSDEVPFPSVANGQFGPCQPQFSDIGMSTWSHASAFIECDDGELQVRLSANKLLTVSHDLTWETLEEKVNMNNYCYSEVRDGEVYFWLRLPRLGKYKLAVFAKEIGQKGGLSNVYNYCINCTGITEDVKPFPPVNGKQWGQFSRCAKLELTPTSHPTGFIEAEEELEIVLDSTKSLEFLHDFKFWSSADEKEEALDDFCCHKVLNEGKRTAVLVRFPHEGEYVLELYAKERGEDGAYGSVVNYLISCKKSAAGCVGFPKVWSKRWGPLYPDFSSMGLSLASHTDPMIHSRTGALQISLNRSKPLQFLGRLYHCENGQQTDLRNNVYIQDDLGEEGKMTARVLMPHTGDYKLQISVKEAEDKGSYSTAINYLIHCSSAIPGSLEFPESFSNWGPGCQVYEPQMRTLPVGKETHFKVAIPDAVDVATISPDGEWSHLTKQEDDTWEGDVTVPGEDFMGKVIKLSAKMNDGKNTYWTILQYVVGEDSSPVPIVWEGNEVGDVQDVQDEEGPKPLTDREQEDSKYEEEPRSPSNGKDEPKDEEEPKSPTDGEQDGSREEEQPKSPINGEDEPRDEEESKPATDGEQNDSRDEEEPKSPTDGEQDGSREEEQTKSPINGEDEPRDEEESKPATDGEQNDSRDEEDTKPTAEEDSRKNEDLKPSNDEDQDDSRDDGNVKNPPDREQDDSTDEGEPEVPTDEEDDSTDDESQGDSENEDELHQPTDGQEEDYKVILRQHQATIEETMNPEMVIPKLEQEGFVDDEEAKELLLMVPENLPEVNRKILKVVQREGEDAFVILRDVMSETGQDKITEVIEDVVIVVPDDTVDKLRKKLAEATLAKNKGRLEKIMAECREHGMDEDDDVFKEAQRTQNLIEAREGLRKAIKTRHRNQIQAALKAAQPFRKELRKHMKEAKEIIEKIKRLDKLRHAIMDMNQATIAEIKTYNNPPPAVYNVMMATFLLLGNTMAQVNDWKSLLVLIGKTGRQSLKRRVKNCEPANISPETAAEAKLCLGDLSLDGVRDQSSGAATFYVWSVGTISEVEEMSLNKQDKKAT